MTRPFTGLNNPYGAYRQAAKLIYSSGFVIVQGDQDAYIERSAWAVNTIAKSIIRKTAWDLCEHRDAAQVIEDLKATVRYWERSKDLEHITPEYRKLCETAAQYARRHLTTMEGGWAQRMFPMFEKNHL